MLETETDAALPAALRDGDAIEATRLLDETPDLASRINQPWPGLSFGGLLLGAAADSGRIEMVDLLIDRGADLNARTAWWAGGFGVLELCPPEIAADLIARGALVSLNAAARLCRVEDVRRLVATDVASVKGRGGDGQTPLHVAATPEIAALLVDAGADIDARDVDHESTPAQYAVRERTAVAQFLVDRGCAVDIMLAAALGDANRIAAILDEDPSRIATRVTDDFFPMRDARAGGHIYKWTLGYGRTPHAIAHEFGHDGVQHLLMERSPDRLKLALSAEAGDESAVAALLRWNRRLSEQLTAAEWRWLPDAAEMQNSEGVRLMVRSGWPLETRGSFGATALHFAAWHGDADLVQFLLENGGRRDLKDARYEGTPLDWADHGRQGDYERVRALLL